MKHDFNTLHLLWSIRGIPPSELNGYEKSILYTLLSCTKSDNLSWHSFLDLSDLTCFSLDTVRRSVRSLEQKKYIIVTKPPVYGRNRSNEYELNIEKIMYYCPVKKDSYEQPFTEDKGSYQQPLNTRKGSSQRQKGSSQLHERVANSQCKKEREERKKNARARASSEAPSRASEPVTCKVLPGGYKVYSNVMKDFIDEMHEEWAKEDLEKNKAASH